jgi:hypothetical protein
MAAKTPSTITPIVFGNRRGYVAAFSDIDDTDTFTPASTVNPLHFSINNLTDGTVISAVVSSGVFTFTVAGSGSNKAATLLVIQ